MEIIQHNPEAWSQIFSLANDFKKLIFYQSEYLVIYNILTNAIDYKIQHQLTEVHFSRISVSEDNNYCCVVTSIKGKAEGGKMLLVFDLPNRALINSICPFHLMDVFILKFMPQSHILASLSLDSTVKFYNVITKNTRTILTQFVNYGVGLDFIQANKNCVLIDNFFNIKIIDFQSERIVKKFRLKQGRCSQASTAKNGISIYTQQSYTCYHHQLATVKMVRKYQGLSFRTMALRQCNQIILIHRQSIEKIDTRIGKITQIAQVPIHQFLSFCYFKDTGVVLLENNDIGLLKDGINS